MAVITISRESFALGSTIAKRVADELGYRLVTKDIFEKILRQYGLVQLDELQKSPSFWSLADASNQELISRLNKTILGFAQLDNMVILGRGGFAVLQEYANVFNIRIHAPFDLRVARLVAQEELGEAAAQKQIAENDKARTAFVKGFYDADLNNAKAFQLVLDTDTISIEMAVDWITEAARALDARALPADLTTKRINVESILAGAIQQALQSA